jgi:hypothetical protein
MKKKSLLLSIIAIVICTASIFAQGENNRSNERLCKDIIDSLRKVHKDDAIAVDIFRRGYEIINRKPEQVNRLLNRHYTNIIQYFDTEDGKDCICRSTVIRLNNRQRQVLIYDPPK